MAAGLAVAAVHNAAAGPFRLPGAQGNATRVPEARRCGCCGVTGHNSRTCPQAAARASAGGPADEDAAAAPAGQRILVRAAAPGAPRGVAGAGLLAPRAVPGRARADADDGNGLFHFSVTIVNGQGRDVIAEHLDATGDFAASLAPPSATWVVGTERGAKEGHLHFQGLFATCFSNSTTLTRKLKAFFATLGPRAANYSVRCPRAASRVLILRSATRRRVPRR